MNYSAEELAWLGEHRLTAENIKAFRVAFNRPNATRDNLKFTRRYHNISPPPPARTWEGRYVTFFRDGVHMTKHKALWEDANGPIPDGMRLSCIDGDKTNFDPSNWEPLPHSVINYMMRLKAKISAEPELRSSIVALAKLKAKLAEY